MKKILLVSLFIAGCGYMERGSELLGQVKKVTKETPLLCYDHYEVDISLGAMKNGVGSISNEDIWLYVPDEENRNILKQANQSGALVKVTYDRARLTFCVAAPIVTKVEIIK